MSIVKTTPGRQHDVDWVADPASTTGRAPGRATWWGITRPAAAKAALVAVGLGGIGVGAWTLAPTPRPVHVPEEVLAQALEPVPEQPAEPVGGVTAGEPAFVHVTGAVIEPGLIELPEGSRVADAIGFAGGPATDADLAAINLAAKVSDGEQIYVPTFDDERPPGPAPPAETPGLVNVNTAAAAELTTLAGIGPVLAERIIAHRTDHGPFTHVEDLLGVSGIGPALMATLRSEVTL